MAAAQTAALSSMDMHLGRTGGKSVLEQWGAVVVMHRHGATVQMHCGATGGPFARALVQCYGSLAYGPVYPLAQGDDHASGTPGAGLGRPECKMQWLEMRQQASG